MLSLRGNWKYIIDEKSELSFSSVLRLIESKNFDGEIKIPANWNLAEFENFAGTLWHIKEFDLPKNDMRKKIVFNGVDYFADVWLNGKYLGSHEGYFQRFSFYPPNDIFKEKRNVLIVKVKSPIEEPGKIWPDKKKLIKGIFNHHDCRPGGWDKKRGQEKNTGGIWNDVKIIFEKEIVIERVKIDPKLSDNRAQLKISIKYFSFSDAPLKSVVKIEAKSKSGKKIAIKRDVIFKAGYGSAIFLTDIERPELWLPRELGKPALYEITISSKYFNAVKIKTGIREINLTEKNEFIINGKRLFLRGTNIIPEQFLSALTSKKIKKLVSDLIEANVNIVRVHAHVNRKELYEAFDEAGILVWQDFALQWTYDESNEFKENSVRQIKDMVRQYFNHPSIVFWCCHNEPGEQINTLDKYLFNAVKEEDRTRIVRKASNYNEHPYDGWYWGKADDFVAAPMGPLVTEFGAQALPEIKSLRKILSEKDINELNWKEWEYHNFQYEQTFNVANVGIGKDIGEFIDNSQLYQSELLEKAIDFYRRKKWNGITGIFQFMFVDCWESISWSVVDYFGKRKSGYYALKKAFEPLYISIDLKKEKYSPGAELFMEIKIINDLHRKINRAELRVLLGGKIVKNLKNIVVPKDDVVIFPFDKFRITTPKVLGRTELKIEFVDSSGKVLISNEKEIEILPSKTKWGEQ